MSERADTPPKRPSLYAGVSPSKCARVSAMSRPSSSSLCGDTTQLFSELDMNKRGFSNVHTTVSTPRARRRHSLISTPTCGKESAKSEGSFCKELVDLDLTEDLIKRRAEENSPFVPVARPGNPLARLFEMDEVKKRSGSSVMSTS